MSTRSNHRPARHVAADTVAAGDWLRLETIRYQDEEQRDRTWEAACRQTAGGAVVIIARLLPSNRYVFVKQYRPPAKQYVIEFPAGLIDPGESVQSAAHREMLEETGYTGQLVRVTEPAYSSPGLSGEYSRLVLMDIDERREDNRDPRQNVDEGEQISVHTIPADDCPDFLRKQTEEGVALDSKVLTFFLGRTQSAAASDACR